MDMSYRRANGPTGFLVVSRMKAKLSTCGLQIAK